MLALVDVRIQSPRELNWRRSSDMTEGRIIAGRYQLQAKLGQGGMGSVYRALHLELGTPVAVKLIEPAIAQSKTTVARFRREAQAAASIRSANVVQILDFGIDDETPYIVMEHLEGESLAARLIRQNVLPAPFVANIIGQVGKALERAHAMSIVHRDLKPDNIYLVRDGRELVAKVLDFGIAKTETSALFDGSVQTQSGAILGTPHYMSPEQASGRSNVDYTTDIWAMGVIVFQCLTGFRPFNGATLGGLVVAICSDPILRPSERGTVPKGTDAWFAKATSREKEGRFSSIAEAVIALKQVCDSLEHEPGELGDGLRREATAIASGRGESLPQAVCSLADPSFAESDGTVAPAAHTVRGLRRRRSYLTWTSVVIAVAGLAGTTLFARSAATRKAVALSAQPTLSLPATASLDQAAPEPVASVLAPSSIPKVPEAAPGEAQAYALRNNRLAMATASPPLSPAKLEADPVQTLPKSAQGIHVDAPPQLGAPAAAPTASAPWPKSTAIEPAAPTSTARPTRRIEDRLAF